MCVCVAGWLAGWQKSRRLRSEVDGLSGNHVSNHRPGDAHPERCSTAVVASVAHLAARQHKVRVRDVLPNAYLSIYLSTG